MTSFAQWCRLAILLAGVGGLAACESILGGDEKDEYVVFEPTDEISPVAFLRDGDVTATLLGRMNGLTVEPAGAVLAMDGDSIFYDVQGAVQSVTFRNGRDSLFFSYTLEPVPNGTRLTAFVINDNLGYGVPVIDRVVQAPASLANRSVAAADADGLVRAVCDMTVGIFRGNAQAFAWAGTIQAATSPSGRNVQIGADVFERFSDDAGFIPISPTGWTSKIIEQIGNNIGLQENCPESFSPPRQQGGGFGNFYVSTTLEVGDNGSAKDDAFLVRMPAEDGTDDQWFQTRRGETADFRFFRRETVTIQASALGTDCPDNICTLSLQLKGSTSFFRDGDFQYLGNSLSIVSEPGEVIFFNVTMSR